ncbi:hypothetical protein T03_7303 [Trichinella britovi]|uniref:Uncharacterized protein n=2 Tax=Trichinella TaxID=6333 RepID=A0A0V1DJK3_TRIBR|nr:hypothetical protein T05_5062 [Trichinella murrelli]KRY61558.1 hypothetical protein T03_7303 [Trichinella britovi]
MDDKLRYICKVSQITLQMFQTALNKTPDILSYFKAAENSKNAKINDIVSILLHDIQFYSYIAFTLSNQAENL